MKYKQLYEAEVAKNEELRDDLRVTRQNAHFTDEELNKHKGFVEAAEGAEKNLKEEVRWLRETLQLVIVDHGNLETLADMIIRKQKEAFDNGQY